MFENNREDISRLDNMFISLIPGKTRVLILGGGRAGYIKARSFSEKGCSVKVVSREFSSEIEGLKGLELIKGEYEKNLLKDRHIVVIAIDDDRLRARIKRDCEDSVKLYIDCKDHREGNTRMVKQDTTGNIDFAITVRGGSPKTSVLLSEMVKGELEPYDAYAEFVVQIRNSCKGKENMKEVLKFVSSEDFLFFFKKGKHRLVLNLFFGGEDSGV